MDSKNYLAITRRDATIASSLSSILRAMSLINGCTLIMAGVTTTLRLEEEMLKAHEALLLLGIDSNELPSA